MKNETESRNTITKLRKKYSLKTYTPFEKLPKVMTPTDYKDYMKATMYPNGKPSEEKQRQQLLHELFKPRF